MIHIKTIHIEEFRGIRELDIDLQGKGFGICGPNGSGKSGVVDAIEFCLTGKISRLSGEGQGNINIKEYAPHIDQRRNPSKAKIVITAIIPSLKKEVAITRCVEDPSDVKTYPNDSDIEAVVGEMQLHPELTLSRREIAKFIMIRPTERSLAVQTLLRLDYINSLRKSFLTCANRYKREAKSTESDRLDAEKNFKIALEVDKLDRSNILEEINKQRSILGLNAISEITPKTSFVEGLIENGVDERHRINKDTALRDIESLIVSIKSGEPIAVSKQREFILAELIRLQGDQEALSLLRKHKFITTGLDLVTEDMCPLCDEFWEADKLRAHLEAKLSKYKRIEDSIKKLSEAVDVIIGAFDERITTIRRVASYGEKIEPIVPCAEIDAYISNLETAKVTILAFPDDYSKIEGAIIAIQQKWWEASANALASLEEIQKGLKALPDSSDKGRAFSFLNEIQFRFKELMKKTKIARSKEKQYSVAQKVHDHYSHVSSRVLEGIYDSVAKEFTKFYRMINDDESKFVGKIKTASSKLNFEVDFFERGLYPPSAYHSEGHQDGMAFCLYLALMKHTLGDKFTLAVLDDALMSIDTGHRREMCQLLKKEFPNTQFILTTHDRIWFQFMKTEKLIEGSKLFNNWNLESGPRIWNYKDVWAEIDDSLDKDDVKHAALELRRYLEYIFPVLADAICTPVVYRENGQYEFGDFLFPVMNQWKFLLGKGIKSAESWNDKQIKEQLSSMQKQDKALRSKIYDESLAINQAVHFNKWENFNQKEFKEVVNAYKDWLDYVRCSNPECDNYPRLTMFKNTPNYIRCSCSAISINLEVKQ